MVGLARQSSPAPVWLVGTSEGTNAVVNAASPMTHGEIAGIVLASAITRPGKTSELKETVFRADLAAIDVPALIVSHKDDACTLTPPEDDSKLQAALSGSPKTEIVTMTGGKPPKTGPCDAFAAHSFYGVEVAAIKKMAAWIDAH